MQGDSAALAKVCDQMSTVMSSEDAAEGVRSFMEQPPAVFKGY